MGLESPLSRGPTLAEVLENWGGGRAPFMVAKKGRWPPWRPSGPDRPR